MLGEQRADAVVELAGDVGGVVVAAQGGQRGEADQVGEEERVLPGRHIPHGIRIPGGMSSADRALWATGEPGFEPGFMVLETMRVAD